MIILGLSSWEQTSGLLQQIGGNEVDWNLPKTWEGLKINSRYKNTEFNTASYCLLVACCSSFKRGFPDSVAAEKSHAVLKYRLSGLCCQHNLCLFQETEHLNGVCEQCATACLVAAWTGYVPRDGAWCKGLGSKEQLHHAGLGRISRQCHIYPSNASA